MANIHGKSAQVFGGNLLKAWDLSAWLNKISAEGSCAADEATTFGNNSKAYVTGLLEAKLSMEGIHEFVAGSPPTGIDPYMISDSGKLFGNDSGSTYGDTVFIVLPAGGNGALADRANALKGIVTDFAVDSPVDNVVTVKADMTGDGSLDVGAVLFPLASRSGSTASTSIDDGAATPALTARVAFFVVSTVFSGTSALFKLQHSTDNASWVDVSGASITATTTTAQRVIATVAANRYIRVNLTTTAATHTSLAGYARKFA